jgi:GTP cyclohydrolase I
MKDIQSQPDHRRIDIQKVGVKNISYPITLLDKEKKEQHTVATVNMYVNLPHHFKGTHMSRFIEILNHFHGRIDLTGFRQVLTEMKTRLHAAAAHVEIDFPYFLKKAEGTVAISEYHCSMHGSLREEEDLTLRVQIPIWPPLPVQTSDVLPKSLGRWGVADICLRFHHFLWIEDLIQAVEAVTSHEHRWPTTPAGNVASPQSVEQITKAIGEKLTALGDDIRWFTVTVKNFAEGCSTFASLEWPEVRSQKNNSK